MIAAGIANFRRAKNVFLVVEGLIGRRIISAEKSS
jgi:hypothetical protein